MASPRVVVIGSDLGAALIVNANDIALQILLIKEGIIFIRGICAGSISQSDRRACLIIEE